MIYGIHSKNLEHSFYSLMLAASLKETNGNQRKAQKQANRLFTYTIKQIADVLSHSECVQFHLHQHIGFFLDSSDGYAFGQDVLAVYHETQDLEQAITQTADTWIEQEYSYYEYLAEYQRTKIPSNRPYWIMLLHLAH